MIRILNIILICFVFVCSCKAQKATDEYIDPVSPSPYKVVRESSSITLPDSLGGKEYSGSAFIQGMINDSALKAQFVRIMKLNIENIKGENVINFYYGKQVDIQERQVLKKYQDFFTLYVGGLQIEKIKGVENKEANIITIPITF